LPPDAGRDSETESSAIAVSFHSFISQLPFNLAIQPGGAGDSMLRLVGRPHEAQLLCRGLRAFVAVAYFAAAAFLISLISALARAREKVVAARF
jgi:hypothetical protein